MAKVLLIEDDVALANFVKISLEQNQYEVDHLVSGSEGLEWLLNTHYDLAIIDWALPQLSGVEICKQYRENGGKSPILMLTGKTQASEMVTGLDSGADDYLPKPFSLEVLHARLRALLRRQPALSESKMTLGLYVVDQSKKILLVDGKEIKLPRKEFLIIELLMKHPGHTFSAEAIMDRAWSSDSETSPETVRSHIARLRSKIAAVSEEAADCLKNIYGLGYKLEV